MKKKLIVFGGEGYIGRVIQDQLKFKYDISSYDNLIYEKDKNIYLKKNNKRKIILGDIGDKKNIKSVLCNFDYVLILAGIVGDPITKKYPNISKKINEKFMKDLIVETLKSNIEKLIFVSTCSNYGISSKRKKLNENDTLKPISLYAKSKVKIEKFILSQKNKTKKICTILRFATAFGSSPRMRFDLTINEFVKTLYEKKTLEVYDSDTWRPYCHVNDFAKIIDIIFNSNKKIVNFSVFNAGSSENNFTKYMVAEKIKKFFKNRKVKYLSSSRDRRDYEVNFNKLKKLNFKPSWSLNKGIKEIIQNLRRNKYKNKVSGNYKVFYD